MSHELMAPLMFAALVVLLLLGYPVAFSLAANGLLFGWIGIEMGLLRPELLQAIQDSLFQRALDQRERNTVKIDSKEDFYAYFTPRNAEKPEIHGGFALAHWNGSREVEEKIKDNLKVTIRCIPFGAETEPGRCILTGEPSPRRVVFAKAY